MGSNKFFKIIIFLLVFSIAISSVALAAQNETNEDKEEIKEEVNEIKPLSKAEEYALLEKSASEWLILAASDINEMMQLGLGTNYVNDLFIDAKKAFEGKSMQELQLEYEVLKQQGKTKLANELYHTIRKAKKEGVKIGENYTKTIELCEKIRKTKLLAYSLVDELKLLELKIDSINRSEYINYTVLDELYSKAETAFQKEKYADTSEFIDETYEKIDDLKIEATRLSLLYKVSQRGVKNFFKKNWKTILIIIVIFAAAAIIFYNRFAVYMLKKKIKDMKLESEALDKLMKKAQKEHFIEGKISKSTYEIKMKNYKDRKTTIEQKLPTTEENLRERKKKII